MALRTNRNAVAEAIRGYMAWNLLDERKTKSVVVYKVRMERMSNDKWPKRFRCGIVGKMCEIPSEWRSVWRVCYGYRRDSGIYCYGM